jgi:hypothetical protein
LVASSTAIIQSGQNLSLQSDSGNVGIGTSSPSEKLSVTGNVTATGTNTSATYFHRSIAPATESGIETSLITTGNGANQRTGLFAYNDYANTLATSLIFKTNPTTGNSTERMRITSAGDVGIGTNNPQYPLTLVNSTANKEILFVKGSNTNTGTGLAGEGPIAIQNTNNTVGNMAAISNFDSGGSINGQINFINTDQAAGGAIGFTTRTNGGASYGERMRITSDGKVVVNKTVSDMGCQMEVKGINPIGAEVTTVTGTGLQVTYTLASGLVYWCNWTYNGSNMGSITSSGSTTAYNTSSDYRLKENIAPITGALAKVAQLKPSTWTWKRNGSDGQGFIAHELAEVCPDAVVGEKDAVNAEGKPIYQGVDTSFLVATLTAAIQEQQAMIEELKAEVAALKENN